MSSLVTPPSVDPIKAPAHEETELQPSPARLSDDELRSFEDDKTPVLTTIPLLIG